ncbi:MAG TPA: DUF4823 domain-containing protein [Steroidobacteraceae bacterium]|nr:DUF4823 domain-containing protein [Steroidobacteraceae bacterium]
MRNFMIVILSISLLTACADSTQLMRNGQETARRLTLNDSIYVAVSKNGSYGNDIYASSGINTSQIIYAEFEKRLHNVEVGHDYQPYNDALKYAQGNNFTMLVYPTILHWEDRATEWSGLPDRVEVKLELVDAQSGHLLDSVVIKGKSGLATFGGDHPQDLLPKPVEEYVGSLFK